MTHMQEEEEGEGESESPGPALELQEELPDEGGQEAEVKQDAAAGTALPSDDDDFEEEEEHADRVRLLNSESMQIAKMYRMFI